MDSWDSIVEWCRDNAPNTFSAIRAAKTPDALASAQRRTGGWNWPADVLDFFSRCDGLERTPSGYVFPGFRPLALEEVVAWWETFLIGVSDSGAAFAVDADRAVRLAQLAADPTSKDRNLNAEPAGTPAGRFISPWLPIAEDQSETFLVVDRRTRKGGQYGCVTEIDDVDADATGVRWPDLSSLLSSVETALGTGAPETRTGLRAAVSVGSLVWRR
ncbi:hypothetical protein Misp01_68860 [Microtetraspora sp. NBRC 13810]|uniref:SMI1/KNR4 family protein n=1 Tax=Microtetraspora sp. NBRC 13810 TaxID=3030990 RepID=UPI0024A1E800|nr:SMI1/KNR4 family protein [Microtetraspora sp. NBRC 13810]GLW11758.1 hypothetical protein Misp01_68860 [Microtetraspora sp. NBRC 13810]